jgi:hypothetical protein
MHRDFGTSCWQLGDEIYVGTSAPSLRASAIWRRNGKKIAQHFRATFRAAGN